MNDTNRQIGGAMGVAVLGSLLSTEYRSSILPALANLPSEATGAQATLALRVSLAANRSLASGVVEEI